MQSVAKKPKIIVILGCTATGKSDLGVALAKAFNGEIISADSRQVYRGLDIGTGKITKKEMRGVRHYMLDVVDPKKRYTVAEYATAARQVITEIACRGYLPIIVGGTGFYIDTLLGKGYAEVPPDAKLRAMLEKKDAPALYKELLKRDKRRAMTIDRFNKRRLIRAIEIARALGKVPRRAENFPYEVLRLGIVLPDEELKQRIRRRLLKRLKLGMVVEARWLHDRGVSWKRMEEFGLEYRYLARFLRGKLTREQLIEELSAAIWQYARRQKHWFKRDKETIWFSPKDYRAIANRVSDFFS